MVCLGLLLLCFLGFKTNPAKCFEVSLSKLREEKPKIFFHPNIIQDSEFQEISILTDFKQRTRRQVQPNFYLIHFNINGQIYSMKLTRRKRSVYSFRNPVWLLTSVSTQQPNYAYKLLDHEETYFEGNYFESQNSLATLLAHYDEVQRIILYDGIFGLGTETHVIRSLPEMRSILSNHTTNEIWKLTNEKTSEHVVIYRAKNYNKNFRSYFLTVDDPNADEKLRSLIDTLYIKILPFIDFELYKLLGENIQETLKYVTTFWNAVDLRFSELYPSRINITVTGVVIVTDEDAFSVVKEFRDKTNVPKVNAYQLLEEARTFFYENFIKDTNFTNYDTIFIMTALDTKPSAGMSYIGRICNRLYSTAFIQDDANYLGLHSATHELGHLVNLFHDGSDDAKDCEPYGNNNISTIMAPIIVKSESMTWSQCSKRSLQEFIKTKAAKCLREAYRSK